MVRKKKCGKLCERDDGYITPKIIALEALPGCGFVAVNINKEYQERAEQAFSPEAAVCRACRWTGCGLEDVCVTFMGRCFPITCDRRGCGPLVPVSLESDFKKHHNNNWKSLVKYRRLILPLVELAVRGEIDKRKKIREELEGVGKSMKGEGHGKHNPEVCAKAGSQRKKRKHHPGVSAGLESAAILFWQQAAWPDNASGYG